MKSEEKQMDLLLYNLGGSRAVNERASKNRKQKSVKVTNRQEQKVAVLPETPKVKSNQPSPANNKTRTNPNTNSTQRKNTKQKPVVVHNNRPVPNTNGTQPNKNKQQPVRVQSNKPAQNRKQTTQVIQAVKPDKAPVTSSQEQIDLEFRLKLKIAYDKAKNQIAKNALAIRKKMPGYVYPSRQEMLLDQQAKENVPSDK